MKIIYLLSLSKEFNLFSRTCKYYSKSYEYGSKVLISNPDRTINLKWFYLQREFEEVFVLWLLWCTCILVLGQIYFIYFPKIIPIRLAYPFIPSGFLSRYYLRFCNAVKNQAKLLSNIVKSFYSTIHRYSITIWYITKSFFHQLQC